MDSLVYNENTDQEDLNKWANVVESFEEAIDFIKKYEEDIIKTNKKNVIFFAYQQGKVFRKFKENRKFKNLVEQFKITKGTIMFKINIFKLVGEYPQMMTSSVTLKFLKSNHKYINNISKENQEDFKQGRVI